MTQRPEVEAPRGTRGRRALNRSADNALPRLLDAGHQAIRSMGYYAASVDDIVRAAGVSRATFYLYFDGKPDLLRALVVDSLDWARRQPAVPEFARGDAGADAYREWLEQLVGAHDQFGSLWDAWRQESSKDVTLELLAASRTQRAEHRFASAIAASPAAKRSQPEVAAVVMSALVEKIGSLTRLARGAQSRSRQLDTLARFVHRGFFGG